MVPPAQQGPHFFRVLCRRPALVLFLLSGLAVALFFGRRLYYRMIQPAPAWSIPTPRTERIVCQDGFRLALWADESLVHDPSALWVDLQDRVWVVEACHYRDSSNSGRNHVSPVDDQSAKIVSAGDGTTDNSAVGDSIVILEDRNQDGTADSRTVFARDPDLIAPMGLCVVGRQAFVACSPHVLVFTDDDGDDRADRKDILLKGFGGFDHDHGLHGLTPGPDGRLYFTVGNAGPHVVTDRSGWTLRSGSYYQSGGNSGATSGDSAGARSGVTLNTGGLRSDDGRIWVGGLVLSVRTDGTDLKVHSHNARNPYEVGIDGCGDVWQADNDDTAGCRITWLMDGANTGFASADGRRSWQADQRPWQSVAEAQWHQQDPGVVPAGEIYGVGAPTGLMRIEWLSSADPLQGALLVCDAGLGQVMLVQPKTKGAGYEFERSKFVWSEQETPPTSRPDGLALTWFRPTDIAADSSGAMFIADWHDSFVGGHHVNDTQADGRIYVVRKTDSESESDPVAGNQRANEFTDLHDMVLALGSASAAVRWTAREQLLNAGQDAIGSLAAALNTDNPFLAGRILQTLSGFGTQARPAIEKAVTHSDERVRVTALRALLQAGETVERAVGEVVDDRSPAVRREAAVRLRGISSQTADALRLQLALHLDGTDRSAIEAFGLACEGVEEQLLQTLGSRLGVTSEAQRLLEVLAWRLHPPSALSVLERQLTEPAAKPAAIHQALDALGFMGTIEAQQAMSRSLESLISRMSDAQQVSNLQARVSWWQEQLQWTRSDRGSSPGMLAGVEIEYQAAVPVTVDHRRIRSILDLPGNDQTGRELFFSAKAKCSECHRRQNRGGDVGPILDGVQRRFESQQIAEAILHPSRTILNGYESWMLIDHQGRTETGLLLSVEAQITLKTPQGKSVAVRAEDTATLVRQGISLMPDSLGAALTNQEIADLIAYLQTP